MLVSISAIQQCSRLLPPPSSTTSLSSSTQLGGCAVKKAAAAAAALVAVGGGGNVFGPRIECSSRPQKKATKHHMKTRPRKTQAWDIRRGPTVYPPLPPLPPDWTLLTLTDVDNDSSAPPPPPPPPAEEPVSTELQ